MVNGVDRMKKCPVCKDNIQEWESLCRSCWKRFEEFMGKKREEDEIVEELKGKAKNALLDLLRELCRQCRALHGNVSEDSCSKCPFAEKERLIRAFLD